MQLSLLDQLPPRIDDGFATARRIHLDETSWVEHVPDWLSAHDRMLRLFVETADWEQHRRNMYDRIVNVPRLVAGFPGTGERLGFHDGEVRRRPSRASVRRIQEASEHLAAMAALLSVRYRKVLESVTLAHYRTGTDSVAFHGDKMGPLRGDTVIAIVSIGDRRRFLLRPSSTLKDRRKPSGLPFPLTFQFGGGDLLVMGGACQRDYEHAVPKMRYCGPRVAIMFREKIPAEVSVARTRPTRRESERSA